MSDLVKQVEEEARAHYSGIPSMRRNVADLLAHVQVELVGQAARIERLEAALRGMMGRYLELANSGDAGNWDPELEDEVIASRAALAELEKEEGK